MHLRIWDEIEICLDSRDRRNRPALWRTVTVPLPGMTENGLGYIITRTKAMECSPVECIVII